jgi:hypothetical protein
MAWANRNDRRFVPHIHCFLDFGKTLLQMPDPC